MAGLLKAFLFFRMTTVTEPMPVPKIVPQTDDEKRRFKEGGARAKQHKKLREKTSNLKGHV